MEKEKETKQLSSYIEKLKEQHQQYIQKQSMFNKANDRTIERLTHETSSYNKVMEDINTSMTEFIHPVAFKEVGQVDIGDIITETNACNQLQSNWTKVCASYKKLLKVQQLYDELLEEKDSALIYIRTNTNQDSEDLLESVKLFLIEADKQKHQLLQEHKKTSEELESLKLRLNELHLEKDHADQMNCNTKGNIHNSRTAAVQTNLTDKIQNSLNNKDDQIKALQDSVKASHVKIKLMEEEIINLKASLQKNEFNANPKGTFVMKKSVEFALPPIQPHSKVRQNEAQKPKHVIWHSSVYTPPRKSKLSSKICLKKLKPKQGAKDEN